jgi:hypothetical protein
MTGRSSEEGKGTISSIIWLLALAAVGYAIINVGPAYVHHYDLQDKMVELCRMGRMPNVEQRILDQLMKTVREEELDAYVHPQDFQITSVDTSRRITVSYDRELKVLPGWVKTFHFEAKAEALTAF